MTIVLEPSLSLKTLSECQVGDLIGFTIRDDHYIGIVARDSHVLFLDRNGPQNDVSQFRIVGSIRNQHEATECLLYGERVELLPDLTIPPQRASGRRWRLLDLVLTEAGPKIVGINMSGYEDFKWLDVNSGVVENIDGRSGFVFERWSIRVASANQGPPTKELTISSAE